MNFLSSISEPIFIVDETRCRANIQRIHNRLKDQSIEFRPHFKTHQSSEIGNWFRDFHVDKITVSSLKMAQHFYSNGWNNITIAFPVFHSQIKELSLLAKKCSLNIIVNTSEIIDDICKNCSSSIGIYIEVDAGYPRSGMPYCNSIEVAKLIRKTDNYNNLIFRGLLAHFGNTYSALSKTEVEEIYKSSLSKLMMLKESLQSEFGEIPLSIGDTPSASIIKEYGDIDEFRPGNFVFYDLMQEKIGSCSLDQISAIIAAPIVESHSDRNEIVVQAGAVHLSKDNLVLNSQTIWGLPVIITENGWKTLSQESYVKSLSQEHGIIHFSDNDWSKITNQQWIGIIPVHSCLAADNFEYYYDTYGKKIKK